MPELSPEAPHLSVAVYGDQPESETFAQACAVVQELGGAPLHVIEVAPADKDFELLSDLGDMRRTIEVDSPQYARLLAGCDPTARVLKAGHMHEKFGLTVVEYILRVGAGAHPIGISMGAEWLGIPDELWTDDQRQVAYELGDWNLDILRSMTSRSGPLYGSIGVEHTLPTPSQLGKAGAVVTTELYVSYRLLGSFGPLRERLAEAFTGGAVVEWERGLFYSGWAPYNPHRVTVNNPEATMNHVTKALAQAISQGS